MYAVQVRKTEPLQVLSIAHKGPYQELGAVYHKFEQWLQSHNIPRTGFFREIGYDNPMTTPPEECRQEICLPIARWVAADGEIQVKQLPQLTVASIVHNGGLDFGSLGPAYQALMGWAAQEGKTTAYSIITYYTPLASRESAEVEIALVLV
jgi:DNA gyrase inhibitor GyrI